MSGATAFAEIIEDRQARQYNQHQKRKGNAAALAPYQIKPGEVRNPNGRPKIPQAVKDAARAHTEEAIATLAEAMRSKDCPWATRVVAADKLLDRAWGRPELQVEAKGEKRDLLEYSIADLVAIAYQRGMEGGSIEGEMVHDTGGEAADAQGAGADREAKG